jgi:hypothetical protein
MPITSCYDCQQIHCSVCLLELGIEIDGLTMRNICYKCFLTQKDLKGEENLWIGMTCHSVRKIIGRLKDAYRKE